MTDSAGRTSKPDYFYTTPSLLHCCVKLVVPRGHETLCITPEFLYYICIFGLDEFEYLDITSTNQPVTPPSRKTSAISISST